MNGEGERRERVSSHQFAPNELGEKTDERTDCSFQTPDRDAGQHTHPFAREQEGE